MNLFVWSDIPNDYWHKSQKGQAEGRAGGSNTRVEQAWNVSSLVSIFRRVRDGDEQVEELRFFTHGNKGQIDIGPDAVVANTFIRRFSSERFETMFEPDCLISFEGCNCAAGREGEYFLVWVGKTLLRTNGGKVRGSTATTFQYVGNPLGSWVYAHIGPGGGARLEGEKHLNVPNIQRRAREAQAKYDKRKSMFGYALKQKYEDKLERLYYLAFIADDTWNNNLDACELLDYFERVFYTTLSMP